MSDAPQPQQKYQQFVQLLPLTLAIAGLPASEHGKYYNEDQMENRARTIRLAYKQARNLTREIVTE
ncbi:MAG: hypothetical protein U1D30_03385 [Planctomycetota bacterium]